MKTALWKVSLIASQAGENSQTNSFEYTIESSVISSFQKKTRRKEDTAKNVFKTEEKSSSNK
jgi:hypothetical protein